MTLFINEMVGNGKINGEQRIIIIRSIMSRDKDKEKIIRYVKEYYSKYKKNPSMKEITIKCRINSRVFYELFKNQEEAFNLAGIPYSDVARKKVEKANLARKDKKNENTEKKPRRVIYVKHSRKYSDKYIKKSALMLDKLSISYMSYRRSNPHDFEVLINIYDSLKSLIIEWYGFLEVKDPEYEIVKSLRNSLDHNKYNMISLGYDYSDLEASYYEICKNEFKEMVLRETKYLDTASLRYFYAMLNDIFGDPPDLILVT